MDSSFARPRVIYSCYTKVSREGENFIADHVFTYIASGSLSIADGSTGYVLKTGDFAFYSKNSLAKFTKLPAEENGEFKALSVRLDTAALQAASTSYPPVATTRPVHQTVIPLQPHPLYQSFAQSLIAYLEQPEGQGGALFGLKVNEAILILLETRPDLAPILFDFKEPGKTDLEAFMMRNFHFNVALPRFAYLTGRSLSTFKRDFEKIFGTTPNKWLQQKRLEEAHYLIREKGKKPSDVYVEVGFENLSHFSFAFKKAYGMAPSRLIHV